MQKLCKYLYLFKLQAFLFAVWWCCGNPDGLFDFHLSLSPLGLPLCPPPTVWSRLSTCWEKKNWVCSVFSAGCFEELVFITFLFWSFPCFEVCCLHIGQQHQLLVDWYKPTINYTTTRLLFCFLFCKIHNFYKSCLKSVWRLVFSVVTEIFALPHVHTVH